MWLTCAVKAGQLDIDCSTLASSQIMLGPGGGYSYTSYTKVTFIANSICLWICNQCADDHFFVTIFRQGFPRVHCAPCYLQCCSELLCEAPGPVETSMSLSIRVRLHCTLENQGRTMSTICDKAKLLNYSINSKKEEKRQIACKGPPVCTVWRGSRGAGGPGGPPGEPSWQPPLRSFTLHRLRPASTAPQQRC